jgi:hypothetical protein
LAADLLAAAVAPAIVPSTPPLPPPSPPPPRTLTDHQQKHQNDLLAAQADSVDQPLAASACLFDGDGISSEEENLRRTSNDTGPGFPRMFRAPYLLEKLVRISAFQLLIPLPRFIHAHSSARRPSQPAVDASCSRDPDGFLVLPERWSPGVSIDGDSAECSYESTLPAVHVIFELPRVPGAKSACAYDISAADSRAAAALTPRALAALPRDVFRLSLRLQHRVERSKCSMRIERDHIVLRLPMFFGGAALPDRPQSLVTLEETMSLRRGGRRLACRECRNSLMSSAPPGGPMASFDSGTEAMRAYPLPSEYWLEFSDFWLCHESQANVLIPDVDFGAVSGTLLIGETHLQVHPRDMGASAVLLRPLLRAPSADWEADNGGGGDGDTQDHDASRGPIPIHAEALLCAVECARCSARVGTCRTVLPAGSTSAPLLTLLPTSDGALLPSLALSAEEWGDRLTPAADPVVRLYKDRLAVPFDAALATPSAAAAVAMAAAAAAGGNALHRYGICSRLAADLLAASHAHSKFKFLLVASDEGDSGRVETAAGAGSEDSSRYPSRVKVALSLLNWNSSVRGTAQHRPWTSRDEEEACGVGGAGGAPHTVSFIGGGSRRWEPDSFVGADVAALQVQFRVLAAHPLPRAEEARLDDWQAGSAAMAVPLMAEEIEGVISALASSCALLPPSARFDLRGFFSSGWLPI